MELLLTVSLISVVMVVVVSVFSAGIRTWGRGEDAAQQHQRLRFLRYKLGLDFRNAIPYGAIPMEGEKEGLRVVRAERPKGMGDPQWVEVRYRVEPHAEGKTLVRSSISLLTGEEKKETLLEEASHIQFLYPFQGEEGELLWREEWKAKPGESDFPRWVKAEILLEKEELPWVQIFALPHGKLTEEAGEETP